MERQTTFVRSGRLFRPFLSPRFGLFLQYGRFWDGKEGADATVEGFGLVGGVALGGDLRWDGKGRWMAGNRAFHSKSIITLF
jgi:hypothetical protein